LALVQYWCTTKYTSAAAQRQFPAFGAVCSSSSSGGGGGGGGNRGQQHWQQQQQQQQQQQAGWQALTALVAGRLTD
jgi:hypothetical protein